MPVENDTSHQNGQEDTGGGGSNVTTETQSQQPQQATEPIATTIVNGTHPKVPPTTGDDQGRQESPKDPKKVRFSQEPKRQKICFQPKSLAAVAAAAARGT